MQYNKKNSAYFLGYCNFKYTVKILSESVEICLSNASGRLEICSYQKNALDYMYNKNPIL